MRGVRRACGSVRLEFQPDRRDVDVRVMRQHDLARTGGVQPCRARRLSGWRARSRGVSGPHEHAEGFIVAEAQLRSAQADNTRDSGLDHLDRSANPQAQFFQPVHFIGLADKLANQGPAAGGQKVEWKEFVHGGKWDPRGGTDSLYSLLKLSLTKMVNARRCRGNRLGQFAVRRKR